MPSILCYYNYNNTILQIWKCTLRKCSTFVINTSSYFISCLYFQQRPDWWATTDLKIRHTSIWARIWYVCWETSTRLSWQWSIVSTNGNWVSAYLRIADVVYKYNIIHYILSWLVAHCTNDVPVLVFFEYIRLLIWNLSIANSVRTQFFLW